ncbi:MAG: hypothetical protein H8E31_05090 [Planctomycetes bacterium]|nr:hypothetical protein [Planctomycetota bacterium]
MFTTLPTLLLAAALTVGGGENPANTSIEKELYAWSLQSLEVPAQAGQSFQLRVVLDEWFDAELVLDPYSVRSANFKAYEQGADGELREIQAPASVTYRGMVAGIPGSIVSAAIIDGQLRARIDLNDGSTVRIIEPLTDFDASASKDMHVVYDSADVLPDTGWVLGEPLLPPVPVDPIQGGGSSIGGHNGHDHADSGAVGGSRGARADETVEMACDADYQFFQKNGSNSANTIADVEAVINDTETIYQRDTGICYDLTTVVVRTSSASNPYTSNDPGTLLNQFRAEWLNNQGHIIRDVAQLFTGRSINGSVIGIAWLGGICNTYGYSMVQSRYTSNWSRRVSLSTHELGHNWNAGHCCGSCSGCSTCRIMCPCNGGCSGNVTSFGTASINAIVNYKNSRNCLDNGCGGGSGGNLNLSALIPGNAGQVNRLDITGATPNSLVTIYFSANTGITAVSGCTGLYLGLQNPKTAGSTTADAAGDGSFSKSVPASAAGKTFYIQAAETAGCQISNMVTHTF